MIRKILLNSKSDNFTPGADSNGIEQTAAAEPGESDGKNGWSVQSFCCKFCKIFFCTVEQKFLFKEVAAGGSGQG